MFFKYFCIFELPLQFSMSTDFFINFDFKNDWVIAFWKFRFWITMQQFSAAPYSVWSGSISQDVCVCVCLSVRLFLSSLIWEVWWLKLFWLQEDNVWVQKFTTCRELLCKFKNAKKRKSCMWSFINVARVHLSWGLKPPPKLSF